MSHAVLVEALDVLIAELPRAVQMARTEERAAAWDVAEDILRPTVETLQQSALDLLDRMLACGEHRREGGE